jgi:hypothetical protein
MNENKVADLKLSDEQVRKLFQRGIIYTIAKTSRVLEDNQHQTVTQEYIELLRNALYATLKVRAGEDEIEKLIEALFALKTHICGVDGDKKEFIYYLLEKLESAINKQYLRALAYNPNNEK